MMTWYSRRSPNCCNKDVFPSFSVHAPVAFWLFLPNLHEKPKHVSKKNLAALHLQMSRWFLSMIDINSLMVDVWGVGPFGHGLLLPQLQTHLAPQPPRHHAAPKGLQRRSRWRGRCASALALWEVQLYASRRDLDFFWGNYSTISPPNHACSGKNGRFPTHVFFSFPLGANFPRKTRDQRFGDGRFVSKDFHAGLSFQSKVQGFLFEMDMLFFVCWMVVMWDVTCPNKHLTHSIYEKWREMAESHQHDVTQLPPLRGSFGFRDSSGIPFISGFYVPLISGLTVNPMLGWPVPTYRGLLRSWDPEASSQPRPLSGKKNESPSVL